MQQEPYLSEEQQIALFHAVGRRIMSIVTGTRGPTVSEQVPEIASIPLLGAFVSLKRQGELRSCMGTMSDQMPLGQAVEQAAIHASKDDPRFPPITAAELFELEMEIWILWGMQRVAQRGTDRLSAIEIGRHGVQISKGGNRGLLLPGVAIEHGMDAKTFLEAVCRKAGLSTDAWLDDASLLHRFEGRSIRGPLSATENIDKMAAKEMIFAAKFNRGVSRIPGPSLAETEQLRDVCLKTFRGMVDGLAPGSYFVGLFDGNISGIVLSFRIPDRSPIFCSKISVRPDVPLQASLVDLLKVLGRQVERFGVTRPEVQEMELDLMVFWDPTIHGNAAWHDLSTVDTAYRSLMLSCPKGWVVQYNPHRSAEELLKQAVKHIEPDDLNTADVISFEVSATSNDFFVSSVSRFNRGSEIRPSAIAGAFFPNNADKMNAELNYMIRAATPTVTSKGKPIQKRACNAVLVPHAGWRYSGILATKTLLHVDIPDRIIIFAPKHHQAGPDWAVAPNRVWQLPNGNIESDLELAELLVQGVDLFEFDAEAHAKEHAVEVQLPIIKCLAPEAKIVGVALALSSWAMIQQGAAQLADLFKLLENRAEKAGQSFEMPLFCVSSDMNHFASNETTRKVDRMVLDSLMEAVEKQKPEHFLTTVLQNGVSMCGVVPMTFVLETLRQLGKLNRVTEIGYTTSAEETGDTSRVVGYAGAIFR